MRQGYLISEKEVESPRCCCGLPRRLFTEPSPFVRIQKDSPPYFIPLCCRTCRMNLGRGYRISVDAGAGVGQSGKFSGGGANVTACGQKHRGDHEQGQNEQFLFHFNLLISESTSGKTDFHRWRRRKSGIKTRMPRFVQNGYYRYFSSPSTSQEDDNCDRKNCNYRDRSHIVFQKFLQPVKTFFNEFHLFLQF